MSLRLLFFNNLHKLYSNFYKTTDDTSLSKRLTQKIISLFRLHKIEFINTKNKNFRKFKNLNFRKNGMNLNLESQKIDITLLSTLKL